MPATSSGQVEGKAQVIPRWRRLDQRPVLAAAQAFVRHNGLTSSAALAFYFLMSLLPFLIFLASALAVLPVPHLAARMVQLSSHFVPNETMPLVHSMLTSTMHANNGLVSAGFLLAVIAASNAFAVTTTSLNAIYEGGKPVTFWKSRLIAIYITFAVGGMTTVALGAMLLGPHFARELARVFNVSDTFVDVWPVLRYLLAISCALASIEVLYYLGPSRKHTLGQQFPGSVFAVVVWLASSGALGIYLRRFSYLNAMYGTLASFVVFMIWLQITAAAILLGAELNVALERQKTAKLLGEPVVESPAT
jgi:membrane protein